MKYYLINGSNRKSGNTAKLLEAVAEGMSHEVEKQDLKSEIIILNLS